LKYHARLGWWYRARSPSLPLVRKPNRRSIATLIRVRQELHKRLDAVLPIGTTRGTVASVLSDAFASQLLAADDPDALRRLLAGRAKRQYPLRHLADRPVGSLPAADKLMASAYRCASGEWEVYGMPVRVDVASHDWVRHPFTGVRAADSHWSRVAYIGGVGGGDVKQIWELNRHGQLLRIAQAYHLTRDDSLAETALSLLDRWIVQNAPAHGVNWTSSLEVAFRAIAWCWIWVLTCDSTRWTEARLGAFLHSLWHHGRHVARFDSVHHSPNTHLTGEALGLLYIGLFFPELSRADAWVALGREILDGELEAQVLPDGMHFERATGYHRYTLEFYVHYLLLASAFALPGRETLIARVRQMAGASWLLRRPDGTWPIIGDEDSGSTLLLSPTEPQDHMPTLAVAAALCDGDDLSWLPRDDARRSAAWWLLDTPWSSATAAHDRQLTHDPSLSGALRSAGYYVGRDRSDTNAWFCVVDAGPHGGDKTGHAHTDLGHVEVAHGATHLVVDPGCAVYTTDAGARDPARSERVHACLVVDGAPLAVPAGPFAWARVAPTPNAVWGDTERFWWCELWYHRTHRAGSLTHRRQVVLARGLGITVCDWITGDPADGMALHWPLGAPVGEISLVDGGVSVADHHIRWHAADPRSDVSATLEFLDQSPGYGRSVAGQLLRLALPQAPPITVVTTFSELPEAMSPRFSDTGQVRITLADNSFGAATLVITPGGAPTIDRLSSVSPARDGALR
jgi:heparinase II/III-like protein